MTNKETQSSLSNESYKAHDNETSCNVVLKLSVAYIVNVTNSSSLRHQLCSSTLWAGLVLVLPRTQDCTWMTWDIFRLCMGCQSQGNILKNKIGVSLDLNSYIIWGMQSKHVPFWMIRNATDLWCHTLPMLGTFGESVLAYTLCMCFAETFRV